MESMKKSKRMVEQTKAAPKELEEVMWDDI